MHKPKTITRTFVRSEKTTNDYRAYRQGAESKGMSADPFKDRDLLAIKSFTHWLIVPNTFPYDAIADVSHMLLTKRDVVFDWSLLTKDELAEFKILKETYLKDTYDLLWENLPNGRSIPGHFHLHLLTLKRESVANTNIV